MPNPTYTYVLNIWFVNISNNSIKHKTFVYTLLNDEKFDFKQFSLP